VRHRTAGPAPPANSTPVVAVVVNGSQVSPNPGVPLPEAGVARLLPRRPWQPRSNDWCLRQASGSGGRKAEAGRFRGIWGRHRQFCEVLIVASPGRDLPAAVGALVAAAPPMGSLAPFHVNSRRRSPLRRALTLDTVRVGLNYTFN
jgi:hypothetical protein